MSGEIESNCREYRIAGGIPDGPDDGTLAPWAVIALLPFAPEIVLPSIRYFHQSFPEMTSKYGFKCSFNPTFSEGWRLMRSCPHIVTGLRRAGFSGGWLHGYPQIDSPAVVKAEELQLR